MKMQVINYYKELFQENLKLIVSFISSAEDSKISGVGVRYGKARKSARSS